jgi:hypothetical protein
MLNSNKPPKRHLWSLDDAALRAASGGVIGVDDAIAIALVGVLVYGSVGGMRGLTRLR